MIDATLVLEGGAKRGVFTAGALDYLMEEQIYFSHVIGVSAGACNAMGYTSRQIGRTKDCMIQNERKYSYYPSMKTVIKEKTLIDMEKLFHRFSLVDFPFDFETFFASETTCEMVVTNCETGKAEYLTERSDKERVMKICRASSSLPLVAPIVKIDEVPYLDGGLADSVPLKRAMEIGNKKIVLILTRQKGYRKKALTKTRSSLCYRAYNSYPRIVEDIIRRSGKYNHMMDIIDRLEAEGKIFVIRPQVVSVGRMENNVEKLNAFYQHGYDSMKEAKERLERFVVS